MAITNFIIGTSGTIGVGAAGQGAPGGTFTNLGGVTSFNFTLTNDEVDFSTNDVAYDIKRYGRQRASGSVEFLYDPGDAAQNTLLGNCRAATITAFRLRPQGAGSYNEYAFDALVTSANPTIENNGNIRCTVNYVSTGAIDFDADQS